MLKMFVMLFLMISWSQIAWAALPVSELGSLLGLDLRVFVAGKPIYFVLVEKDKQRLRVLKHDGRLRIVAEYQIATGENTGQKEREGDEKTPEGIYFITKIYTDTKLTVFGKRAFHLDYPNIFDRQEGKGGTGIFIHGTNKKLSSNSTNGCISLNNDDLEHIVKYLPLGVVPVVVVSSLTNLTSDMISDMAVSEFVSNDFQRAREALGLDGADAGQIVFESLYMIGTNSQTVVVGEYQKADTNGKEPGELVRGYLQYTAANGWAVIDRVRKVSSPKGAILVDGRKVNLRKVTKAFVPEIVQEMVPYRSLWSDPDNQYLTWYREALSEGGILQKTEHPIVQKEIRRAERTLPEFAILFFLSVVASIGCAWIVLALRSGEHGLEHGEIDEHSREKQLAAVVRIQKDIAWSSARLAQLKLASESGSGREKELQKATHKITNLERELSALRDRFHIMEEDYQGAIVTQQEWQEQAGKLTILEQKLAEKSLVITELTQEKLNLNDLVRKGVADREEITGLRIEVHDMAAEIAVLVEKNKELYDAAQKRTEDRNELSNLYAKLQKMTADLQEATEERQYMIAQVNHLSLLEKDLTEKSVEITTLIDDNQKLNDSVQKLTEERDKLTDSQQRLHEMAETLEIVTTERQSLIEEVANLTVVEAELSTEVSENVVGEGLSHEVTENIVEEIIVDTVSESYLPSDVLKQWIGA